MKRSKWLKSLGVVASLSMPMATVLTTTTSCGGRNYAELISEMKDYCVEKFMEICTSVHRNAWNEGEGCSYIKKQMFGLGWEEPSGEDCWTKLNAVKRVRGDKDTPGTEMYELINTYGEPDGGDYGNMWYDIDATPGFENVPPIILHCHIDSAMYFGAPSGDTEIEKKVHQYWSSSYIPVSYDKDNETMQAEYVKSISEKASMSLGADGGLGMAVLLTIAKYHNKFNHGKLRLLFAVGESEPIAPCYEYDSEKQAYVLKYQEYSAGFHLLEYDQIDDGTEATLPVGETRLTFTHKGTKPFGDKWEYKYLISTSGVAKNTISISSSGVHECQIEVPDTKPIELNNDIATKATVYNDTGNKINWGETELITWQDPSVVSDKKHIKLTLQGFQGGTTSTYIDNGQGSALRLLAKILFCGDIDLQIIHSYSWPESGYAISQYASMELATFYNVDTWKAKWELELPSFKQLYPNEDWSNITFTAEEVVEEPEDRPVHGVGKLASRNIINMIANQLYFGPINWFDNGDVMTSENIGPCIIRIKEPTTEGAKATTTMDFRVIQRSSDIDHLEMFKHLTHSIFYDGLKVFFGATDTTSWTPKEKEYIAHIHDPAWEAPTEEKPNVLAAAFETAFDNFKIKHKLANEHAWIEISCASDIFSRRQPTINPHMVLVGAQIEQNHSINEILFTDTINALLETTVYVLDNSTSLPK